jgi:hypothetical protein
MDTVFVFDKLDLVGKLATRTITSQIETIISKKGKGI